MTLLEHVKSLPNNNTEIKSISENVVIEIFKDGSVMIWQDNGISDFKFIYLTLQELKDIEAGIVFIWVLSLAFFGGLLYVLWHFV